MSDFDEFDTMGDDFGGFSNAQPNVIEDDDADMFSMFEDAAHKESATGAEGSIPFDNVAGDANGGNVPMATQPAASEPVAAVGAKRAREADGSSNTVAQDFGILHSDPTFRKLFTTPNAVILATPIIVNCIGLVYLGCGVDLRALACSVRNVEYNCSRAPRAVLRLVEPHCSAIIRSNGVVTIVGSGSVHATKTAAELTARIIRCALNLHDLLAVKFRLRTLMVRFDLQRPVRIGNLAADNAGIASYEPETFCACILRLSGTLLSDGSTFGEQPAAVKAPPQPVAAPPPPVYHGALQSEVDDFFAGDDDFGMLSPSPMASGSGAVNQVGAAPATQAKALSAVRWNVSANVFVSGKITMIGSKSVDEVAAAYKKLLAIVTPHMKI